MLEEANDFHADSWCPWNVEGKVMAEGIGIVTVSSL
jgi:hypothetical protein